MPRRGDDARSDSFGHDYCLGRSERLRGELGELRQGGVACSGSPHLGVDKGDIGQPNEAEDSSEVGLLKVELFARRATAYAPPRPVIITTRVPSNKS